jgi:hypothetical protein
MGHDARGDIYGVSLDRVRPSNGWTEVAREHASVVDPSAQWQPAAALDGQLHRTQ